MHSAEKFDVSTLNWVKGEIDETLKQARIALEAYVENSEDTAQLQSCVDHLHQVAGTLHMVELGGAARFAFETEQLAKAVAQDEVISQEPSLEVLMRAILQLPDYLESLQAGRSDNPIILLTLLNEMRQARGEGPVLESEFFSPDLATQPTTMPAFQGVELAPLVRRFRSYYHAALLRLLRNENTQLQLKILETIFDKIYSTDASPAIRQWSWISRGFVEGMRVGGIPIKSDNILLLAKNDRLLKQIADGALPDADLEQQIKTSSLLRIAQSGESGPATSELRKAFHLDVLVQGLGAGEQPLLGGFNAELKRTVSADILEELARAKENFDIFVRGERHDVSGLSGIANSLAAMAETLVLLREETLSQHLREQSTILHAIGSGEQSADDSTLMGVAAAILAVESALSDWGNVSPLEKADDTFGQVSADEVGQLAEAEHGRVIRQVMKESRDGVIRIREAISQYLENPADKTPLSGISAQLHEIVGSLMMLSYRRVAQVLRACGLFINDELLTSTSVPASHKLDALADAIMSIEYYLEAFVQSRVHPASVLEVAENGVAELGYPVDSLPDEAVSSEEIAEALRVEEPYEEEPFTFSLPEVAGESDEAFPEALSFTISPEESIAISVPAEPTAVVEPTPVVEPAPVVESAPVVQPASVAVPANMNPEIDEEILEIFIEEAQEEVAKIDNLLPIWSNNPADEETLRDMRRCFHTLKGSGRLVGAAVLGEFAWAFENMLNRVIDGSIRPGPAMFDMLDQAREAFPQLIANFQSGTPLDDDIEMLRQAAHEIVQPGGMQFAERSSTPAAEVAPALVAAAPVDEALGETSQQLQLDPVLLEIYSKETEGHLEEIASFVQAYKSGSHRVNEPLIRALHTLTGSSRMAGVLPVADVSGQLEKYAKTIQLERLSMTEEGVSLLDDCVSYTRQVVDHLLDTKRNPLPDNAELVARAEALYETVKHAEESVAARPEEGLASKPEVSDVAADNLAWTTPAELEPVALQQADSTSEFTIELEPLASESSNTNGVSDLEKAFEILDAGTGAPRESTDEYSPEESIEIAPVYEPSEDVVSLDNLEILSTDELAGESSAFELEERPQLIELPEEPALPEIVEITPAVSPAPEMELPSFEAVDMQGEEYDPELLDIFLEEGTDILNASEETLQSWVNNPEDRSLVELLQRQLHTLKGGARMAGINPIGDLSHSLESIFEAVVEGRVARSKRMMDLLQLSHDRLVVMLEQVRNRETINTGDDLINAFTRLERGESEPVEIEPQPAVVEEITPPAAEPVPPQTEAIVEEVVAEVRPTVIGDPLEHLLASGRERINQINSKVVAWRRTPDELGVLQDIRGEAEALMHEAGAAVIVELTELAKAVSDLLRAVDDGHVAISEKMFSLLGSCGERLSLIFDQLVRRTSLSNGLYLVANVGELIKSSIAEQRIEAEAAVRPIADAPVIVEAPEPEREMRAEPEDAGDNRRHGPRVQHEMVRVRADMLDNLVNFAGEVSIYRSRVEQQLGAMRFNIDDLDTTVTRLREQVRQFDIETEATIDSRYRETAGQEYEEFDPLEFDRFTHMQQLSRSMMESLNDLLSIEEMMLNLSRESETLLLQQSRVNTELQETLMNTRMIPLVEHAPRLRRIVRQTCAELKKDAGLHFTGAEVEMDRNLVERILAPLEHMLRNSIAHGIESPEKRLAANKPAEGSIVVALSREGSEVVIRVTDDGAGINLDAVRRKAIDKGLMSPDARLDDKEVMHFILESGFSTAETLSQIAGRGVGMDVVASEIKQLGGVLEIESVAGKGTKFTIRLPLTLSVSRALLVYAGEDIYAVPLMSITGIERISPDELEKLLASDQPRYKWVGQYYELMHLSRTLGITSQAPSIEGEKVSILLAQSGDNRVALAVDGLVGSREIVVKSLGAQLSTLQDISGATILADGHVALIIDLPALIRRGLARRSAGKAAAVQPVAAPVETVPTIMVVDDSITVRKVTERLLKRHNLKCVTAKDGVDALTVLEDVTPDVMLLDIEMPRMDGYELATHIRNSDRFKNIPIIMITSRTGEKHRQRAMDIGVNIYMGKPYTEVDLLENIQKMLKERHTANMPRGQQHG